MQKPTDQEKRAIRREIINTYLHKGWKTLSLIKQQVKFDEKGIFSQNMKVRLEAKPNPDFSKNDYNGSINIKAHFIIVNSLKEASAVCSEFIRDNELGGGNWTGGQVFQGKKQIAYVSYNGKVWEPLPFPQAKQILI